jgi:hypothetical protein
LADELSHESGRWNSDEKQIATISASIPQALEAKFQAEIHILFTFPKKLSSPIPTGAELRIYQDSRI